MDIDNTTLEYKICNECEEIYRKSSLTYYWQIMRTSGIPYVKKEYTVMLLTDGIYYSFPGNVKLCLRGRYTFYINHYDEEAINEVENNRCIMKGCDGELEKFEGNLEDIFARNKEKLEIYYFGDEDEIINHSHIASDMIDVDLPTSKDTSCISNL